MKWFSLLGRLSAEKRLPRMAEEIAANSRGTIWSRIVDAASQMSRSEARGYVRARWADVVQEATDSYLSDNGKRVYDLRTQLVDLAIDAVVARAVADLFHGRSQTSIIRPNTIPMPVPVPVRRAA
jgi:hypothetical protein